MWWIYRLAADLGEAGTQTVKVRAVSRPRERQKQPVSFEDREEIKTEGRGCSGGGSDS